MSSAGATGGRRGTAILHRAYLGLGSNIEPERNLSAAVGLLARRVRLLAASSAWETPPVGPPGQPPFLNASVLLLTHFSPENLVSLVLKPIENELGRKRTGDPFEPRTIDLDLLLFEDRVGALGDSCLPEPGLQRHLHVTLPMAELAPDLRHPVTGETLAEIRDRLLASARSPITRFRARPDIVLIDRG